jgi:hypothetical protein
LNDKSLLLNLSNDAGDAYTVAGKSDSYLAVVLVALAHEITSTMNVDVI